jgi:hypothetical protein
MLLGPLAPALVITHRESGWGTAFAAVALAARK